MRGPDGGEDAAPASATSDRRIAAWLAATFLLIYAFLGHGHFKSSDEVAVYEATRSLWERGDLSVGRGTHVFTGVGDTNYSHFAVGQSVLALPFFAAGRLAAATLPTSWSQALAGPRRPPRGRTGGSVEIFFTSLYPAVASALLVAVFFLFERALGASPRSATIAAAVLGGGTYVVMMSAYFLRHTTEALTILAALYGFHRYRHGGRLRTLALASAAAAATVLVRVPAAVAGPALGGYLGWVLWLRAREEDDGWRSSRAAAAVLGPLAVALAIHVAVNLVKWDAWLASPMIGQAALFTTPLHVGLAGLLASPGASIFVYSPPLLLLPWLLRDFSTSHRAECLAVTAIVLSFLLVSATFWSWSGLWASPGPRYLFVATPLLLLPLGPWLDRAPGRGRGLALAVLTALGVAVQLAVTSARWRSVVELMDYRSWEPDMEFLFVPAQSPVLASARIALSGEVDCWIYWLATGWHGQLGRPGSALVLTLLWALALAFCTWRLRRALPRRACDGR